MHNKIITTKTEKLENIKANSKYEKKLQLYLSDAKIILP